MCWISWFTILRYSLIILTLYSLVSSSTSKDNHDKKVFILRSLHKGYLLPVSLISHFSIMFPFTVFTYLTEDLLIPLASIYLFIYLFGLFIYSVLSGNICVPWHSCLNHSAMHHFTLHFTNFIPTLSHISSSYIFIYFYLITCTTCVTDINTFIKYLSFY